VASIRKLGATTMKFRLGTIKNDDHQTSIDLGDELTEKQYQAYLDAIQVVLELESNQRLFDITFINKNDFVDTFNKDIKSMLESTWTLAGDRTKYKRHYLNFNRLFLNYLSSIRSFIDHNETYVKRKFAPNSFQVNEFDKIKRYYFDNFFSYRFFYKLRNYSQHCGLPIRHFNLSTQRKPDGGYFAEAEMTFNSHELLKEYREWGPVKEDLKKINGDFPLAPLVDEMTSVLLGFWRAVDSLNMDNISSSIKYIKDGASHLRAKNVGVSLFSNIRTREDGSILNFEQTVIPFDFIDEFDGGSA
jgi:hypothetical protein